MTLYDKMLEAIEDSIKDLPQGEFGFVKDAAKSCVNIAFLSQIDLCNSFLDKCQGLTDDEIYKMIENKQKELIRQL